MLYFLLFSRFVTMNPDLVSNTLVTSQCCHEIAIANGDISSNPIPIPVVLAALFNKYSGESSKFRSLKIFLGQEDIFRKSVQDPPFA